MDLFLWCILLPSMLWHCWLGGRKSVQPVKNCVMRCWCGYLSGTRCKWLAYGACDATANPPNSVKSGMFILLVLAYPVVPEKRPSNERFFVYAEYYCQCVLVTVYSSWVALLVSLQVSFWCFCFACPRRDAQAELFTNLPNYYYTTTVLRPFVQDYPGESVPEG